MSVIIISSDVYQTGREIAESTAKLLGYGYVGREVLGKAADRHHVAESKLTQALDETPSFLRMSTKIWKRYLAYIQEATLTELLKDNMVCQGLAAHVYVIGISHVLRVLVLADIEKRAEQLATQEGISTKKAKKLLEREKKARRRWSMDAFHGDETDPSRYDLVISLSQIDPDEAVKIMKETVAYARFKPMTYSITCLKDLALSSRVRAELLGRFPDVRVSANSGTLIIETTALKREKEKKAKAIKEMVGKIPGVEYVEVHVINDIFRQAAESFR